MGGGLRPLCQEILFMGYIRSQECNSPRLDEPSGSACGPAINLRLSWAAHTGVNRTGAAYHVAAAHIGIAHIRIAHIGITHFPKIT